MDALRTSGIGISTKTSFGRCVESYGKCFSVIRPLGFASSLYYRQRRRKIGSFCIRRSFAVSSNQHGNGFSASQDGSSAVEDGKKEKGLLLGAEKDDSGSVLGFHLIPQSGMHSAASCFLFLFHFQFFPVFLTTV